MHSFCGWVMFHCVYVSQLLYPFICQCAYRLLLCSSIANSAAMNNGIHVSFSLLVSSGYMPRSGIAGSYDDFIPSFLKESLYLLPQWLYQFTFPPAMQEGSLFSPAFIFCRLFDDGHSDHCEVISHCSFDLHFSNNEWCWASFHMFASHLNVFFGEMSV